MNILIAVSKRTEQKTKHRLQIVLVTASSAKPNEHINRGKQKNRAEYKTKLFYASSLKANEQIKKIIFETVFNP
jgi:hypothetical protein